MRLIQSLALSLLVVTLLPSCDGDSPTAPSLPNGPVEPQELYRSSTSGLTDSQRTVVRTEAALDTIWTEIFSNVAMPDPLPTVDFNRDMVLVVASGEQPDSCYDIEITGATADGIDLSVTVTETGPTTDCICAATLTQPVQVVSVPRADEIFFTTINVSSCAT